MNSQQQHILVEAQLSEESESDFSADYFDWRHPEIVEKNTEIEKELNVLVLQPI